ncbi:poly-gamma-glutamate hydrolase family protein [Marinococcus halophilus]|uniref:poly-gamma-glutamate hydrolase family protein n=1 Tax=Marinococcus halophilus TaxID=1371 RepID=UPI0036091E8D
MRKKKYADYAELQASELEGRDYEIRVLPGKNNSLAALAPHGGAIEAGTSELVEELHCSYYFSGYDFRAKKRTDNRTLHLRSTHFDEQELSALLLRRYLQLLFMGTGPGRKNLYRRA